MIWAQPWVWLAAALVLAFFEVLLPGYVFLGFAIGAALTGLVLFVGGPLALWISGSLPALLLFFAVLSLLSWLGLRRVLGIRAGQVKKIDRDINED